MTILTKSRIGRTLANMALILGFLLVGPATGAEEPTLLAPASTHIVEGSSGWSKVVWHPTLSSPVSVDLSYQINSQDGSAAAGLDYQPLAETFVFPAGRIQAGLPSPQLSSDPDTQKVQLPDAFGIEMLVDLTRPTAVLSSRGHTWLEDGLYVAQTTVHQSTRPDNIFHISWDGKQVALLIELPAEADPTSLAIPPLNNGFQDGLYISSNNRDGGREGDWGGTIQIFNR
ncbi:MAG: hypothetical protein ACPGL0_14890, partial [Limisphaerales bacterium]